MKWHFLSYKMSENNLSHFFPEPKVMSLSFVSPTLIGYFIYSDYKPDKARFIFEKLKSVNVWHSILKNDLED